MMYAVKYSMNGEWHDATDMTRSRCIHATDEYFAIQLAKWYLAEQIQNAQIATAKSKAAATRVYHFANDYPSFDEVYKVVSGYEWQATIWK